MSKPRTPKAVTALDPDHPMASLREAAGLTKAEMARARKVKPPSIDDAEDQGDGVRVRALRQAARAVGGEIEIVFTKT